MAFNFPHLYIISDNHDHCLVINCVTFSKKTIFLSKELSTEEVPKEIKADYEIMYKYGTDLYILGSGSRANRNIAKCIELSSRRVETFDLSNLYQSFKELLSDDSQLNLEGASFYDGYYYFLNRGNNSGKENGMFKCEGTNLKKLKNIEFIKLETPLIQDTDSSFTDLEIINGKAYFLAAAEETSNSYDDGIIYGTMFGVIDLETNKIIFSEILDSDLKFEGLTLFNITPGLIRFFICADMDKNSSGNEFHIYLLEVVL